MRELVSAAPGSGKTTYISTSISRLIMEGVVPELIYAVTFTREAAKEMRSKIGNDSVKVSTVHSLAWSIIKHSPVVEDDPPADLFYNQIITGAVDLLTAGYEFPISCLAIDEAQDLSREQFDFLCILAKKAEHLIVVGDPLQCQPYGTMVRRGTGETVPIENLEVGDLLCSHSRRMGHIYKTSPVLNIKDRIYDGPLYTVTSKPYSTRCTLEHQWNVRWNKPLAASKRVVYLMRRGKWFRVGHCQMFMRLGNAHYFHPVVRARLEKADALWILSVTDAKEDSFAYEQIVSSRYSIPQTVFNPVFNNTISTDQVIQRIYSDIGDRYNEALRCLSDHGLYINYPLYSPEYEQDRKGLNGTFKVHTCNIIPSIMLIPQYAERPKGGAYLEWRQFSIETEDVHNVVVRSLEVDNGHTYVADGLLTCNCIFSFQRSDPSLMSKFKEVCEGIEDRKLDISYRIPTNIARYIKRICPDTVIEPERHGGSIEVVETDLAGINPSVKGRALDREGTTGILFRTNAEIIRFVRSVLDKRAYNYVVPLSEHPLVAVTSVLMSLHTDIEPQMFMTAAEFFGYSGWEARANLKATLALYLNGEKLTYEKLSIFYGGGDQYMKEDAPLLAHRVKVSMRSLLDTLYHLAPEEGMSAIDVIHSIRDSGYNVDEMWDVPDDLLTTAVTRKVHTHGETYQKVDNGSPVTVSTIHGAKGREFDNVIVVVNQSLNKEIQNDEELRVLYVALTRARESLTIILPTKDMKGRAREGFTMMDAVSRTVGII